MFVYSRAGYGRSSPAKLPRPLSEDAAREMIGMVDTQAREDWIAARDAAVAPFHAALARQLKRALADERRARPDPRYEPGELPLLRQLHPASLGEARVHAKQIGREQGRLLAAGASMGWAPDAVIQDPTDPQLRSAQVRAREQATARLILQIAPAVAKAAMESGVATRPIADFDAYHQQLMQFVYHSGLLMKPIFAGAKKDPKRIVYAEGEEERVLRGEGTIVERLLGLEFELAADIIRTVALDATMTNIAALGALAHLGRPRRRRQARPRPPTHRA